MTPERFVARFPRLYHVTMAGGWSGIRRHGLLSTSALLDRHGVTGEQRQRIEAARRPACVELAPGVVVKDNRPLVEKRLLLTPGWQPADWYRELNGRVFLWATRRRLDTHLGAAAYREHPHEVLVVDTAALVDAHGDRLELSAINSGATGRRLTERGEGTFVPLADYTRPDVAEVTAVGSIPGLARFVVDVEAVPPAVSRPVPA